MPKSKSVEKKSSGSRKASAAVKPQRKAALKVRPVETGAFVSLGCPKNLVDSEKMLGSLAEAGIAPISINPEGGDFGGADAVVVNTCGFLEASKDESLGVIKEAIRVAE